MDDHVGWLAGLQNAGLLGSIAQAGAGAPCTEGGGWLGWLIGWLEVPGHQPPTPNPQATAESVSRLAR